MPDDKLVSEVKAVIGELPTYGYRRIHAVLKRQQSSARRKEYRGFQLGGLDHRRLAVFVPHVAPGSQAAAFSISLVSFSFAPSLVMSLNGPSRQLLCRNRMSAFGLKRKCRVRTVSFGIVLTTGAKGRRFYRFTMSEVGGGTCTVVGDKVLSVIRGSG